MNFTVSFRPHDKKPASLQVERNLVDAMGVARNICIDPRLVPGGGACEMAVSRGLSDQASSLQVWGEWEIIGVELDAHFLPHGLLSS